VLRVKVCFPATIVAGVMLCAIPAVFAQQPGGPGASATARPPAVAAPAPAGPAGPAAARPAVTAPTVAVIDIARVFKEHNRFNDMMLDIKKDIEDFDAYVKNESSKLKAMSEALATFKPGSLEYKQREEEAARLTSDLQVKVGLKKKELLEQEARVYFQVYRELEQKVAVFAQQYSINMVLRFNSEGMKEDDRNSVLQGVNRAVVYYHPNLDITNYVVAELNRGTVRRNPPPTAGQPGAGNGTATRPQIPGGPVPL
jgi:Skp family chaperone for outer membrane proteins